MISLLRLPNRPTGLEALPVAAISPRFRIRTFIKSLLMESRQGYTRCPDPFFYRFCAMAVEGVGKDEIYNTCNKERFCKLKHT